MSVDSVKDLFPRDKYSIATGFLGCMALLCAFIVVQTITEGKTVSESRSVRRPSAPLRLFRQIVPRSPQSGYMGAVVGGLQKRSGEDFDSGTQSVDRKMVRTGTLNIFVSDPEAVNLTLQEIARKHGGYIVSSQREEVSEARGQLTVNARVPAARFDEVWAEVRKLGIRVESERVESSDVTKQYIDMEAALRNQHAEEAQYLSILKQAKSVKDILEVTEHLSSVRGQLEKTQGELNYLRHDVEMSALQVYVRAEADTKVLGIYWRPLYQTKVAFRNGVEAITTYLDFMVTFIMYLPVLLLWVFTLVVVVITSYKSFRWLIRRTFAKNPALPQPQQ